MCGRPKQKHLRIRLWRCEKMAELDPEKKFHFIMDKLLYALKPNSVSASSSEYGAQSTIGQKRPNSTSPLALVDLSKRTENVRGSQRSSGVDISSQRTPPCRPWDRDDLMKRMATFKSMTWFGKPKVVDAVNCARRGWVNVEMDIIACESCGARLLFSTPSSWNQQQVEKAALVFSLKLDTGHKSSCPWIDNSCDEKLPQFPPMADHDLMDRYRQRLFSLSQLLSLPIISVSAINHIKSLELDQFLLNETSVNSVDECAGEVRKKNTEIDDGSETCNQYYEAQKIISLCGWEPRSLPYVVDCDNQSTPLHKSGARPNSSEIPTSGQEISVYSIVQDPVAAPIDSDASHDQSLDPNSVVLECKFCGASVGLWAFSKVSRPLECYRFVGFSKAEGQNGPEPPAAPPGSDLSCVSHTGGSNSGALARGSVAKEHPTISNLTIAGGPPATNQNFRAKISVPAIGQNLRIRLFTDHGLGSLAPANLECGQSHRQPNITYQDGKELDLVPSSVENEVSPTTYHPMFESDNVMGQRPQVTGDHDVTVTGILKRKKLEEVSNLNDQISALDSGLRKNTDDGTLGFDPIRQHRHFCPWIISTSTSSPGWKQVLLAWHRQKGSPMSSSFDSAPCSKLIEVDDPISSIRRLFASPSPKRRRVIPGSS